MNDISEKITISYCWFTEKHLFNSTIYNHLYFCLYEHVTVLISYGRLVLPKSINTTDYIYYLWCYIQHKQSE